ncbi:MAG TPA: hypothetical protein VH437_17755 [Terriglobales bacterium]
MTTVDYGDIQGLIRFGFGRMTEACYFLVNVRDARAARAWLASAPITSAIKLDTPPKSALQIAFTREGLEALSVPPNVIAGFSPEFIGGMAGDGNRSLRLGDVEANAPANWRWGGLQRIPHAVVMFFAEPGTLNQWKASITGAAWHAAFSEIDCLPTSNLDGREPFGFVDGISQPELDWKGSRRPYVNGSEREYSNLVCLGEFLLGYPNEYGKYTDRPLLEPDEPAASQLDVAEDRPELRDLGKNGTYVVMRQLEQDVRGFWQFLHTLSNSNSEKAYQLGIQMVGRNFADGSPLVPLNGDAIQGIGTDKEQAQLNQFTYDMDVGGTRCPFGAHIRRANPRNADIPGSPNGLISKLIRMLGFGNRDVRGDLIASTRFHRILRRGREYGPNLSPEEALQTADRNDAERGLHFLALNSNIQRQFEFIQTAWIMRTKFDGTTDESDPLLGNRVPVRGCQSASSFSIPQNGGIRKLIPDLPQFITVRGGAYFFMPSLRALRYLSSLGD